MLLGDTILVSIILVPSRLQEKDTERMFAKHLSMIQSSKIFQNSKVLLSGRRFAYIYLSNKPSEFFPFPPEHLTTFQSKMIMSVSEIKVGQMF